MQEEILDKQLADTTMQTLKKNIVEGKVSEFRIDQEGLIRFQNRCVSQIMLHSKTKFYKKPIPPFTQSTLGAQSLLISYRLKERIP